MEEGSRFRPIFTFDDPLSFVNISSFVRRHEIGHGFDFWVTPVPEVVSNQVIQTLIARYEIKTIGRTAWSLVLQTD